MLKAAVVVGRKAPYRLTAPVVPEHAVQRQIVDVLRLEIAPAGKVSRLGVIWWSVDHANYAGEVPGIRVGRGIIAGIPDIFLLYRGRAHFIEIKTQAGVLSEPQKAVMAAILIGGGRCATVFDANMTTDALDEWGIPRNQRVIL
jgi:hypothetical protein